MVSLSSASGCAGNIASIVELCALLLDSDSGIIFFHTAKLKLER